MPFVYKKAPKLDGLRVDHLEYMLENVYTYEGKQFEDENEEHDYYKKLQSEKYDNFIIWINNPYLDMRRM